MQKWYTLQMHIGIILKFALSTLQYCVKSVNLRSVVRNFVLITPSTSDIFSDSS